MNIEQLILNYLEYLKAISFDFAKTDADREDLIQETVFRALKYKDSLKDNNIKPWLYTLMKHQYINEYRRKQKVNIASLDSISLSRIETDKKCKNLAISNFRLNDISKCINSLKEIEKVSFSKFLSGKKYKEISEEQGIVIGTIKTHIHQARKSLQSKLKRF